VRRAIPRALGLGALVVALAAPRVSALVSPPGPGPARALALEPGSIVVSLESARDPVAPALDGEVVFNPARREGVMRIEGGLPANDPAAAQYQLWILDADRDERYPVEALLFDAPAGSPLELRFRPRLAVHRPRMVLLTMEPRGGVVVSSRERLLAIGRVRRGR
jgi:hypothetical protein